MFYSHIARIPSASKIIRDGGMDKFFDWLLETIEVQGVVGVPILLVLVVKNLEYSDFNIMFVFIRNKVRFIIGAININNYS